jgi:Holliday junction resolvase RusA-like endonuclease
MKLSLTIPGEPCAKGRPRFYNGRAITPTKTVNYETLVKEMWAITHKDKRLEGALYARVTAYFAIPKSASKVKRERMTMGATRPVKRPDIDNLIKSVLDALNEIAYKDDSQVVQLFAEKLYSDIPRVEIELTEIGGD